MTTESHNYIFRWKNGTDPGKCVTQCPDNGSVKRPYYRTPATPGPEENICVDECSKTLGNDREATTYAQFFYKTKRTINSLVHHFCNDKCDVAFDSRDKFYDSSATLNICTPQCPPTDLSGAAVSGREQEFYFWQTTVSSVTLKECKTSCEWANLEKARDTTFVFYKYTRNSIDWCTTVCPPTNIDSSGNVVLTSHANLFLYNKASTHCVDQCSGTEVFIVSGSDRTTPTAVTYGTNFTVNKCRDQCPSDSNSGYSVPQFLTTGTWNSPANTLTHRYCHDNCSNSTY